MGRYSRFAALACVAVVYSSSFISNRTFLAEPLDVSRLSSRSLRSPQSGVEGRSGLGHTPAMLVGAMNSGRRHSVAVVKAATKVAGGAPDLSAAIDMAAGLGRSIEEAMEFAKRADDGVQPQLWEEADVVLVGPSRTGKTTLANYLAERGLKVANYPLVPGEDPPPELLQLDQRRVVKLTTQPEQLQAIRQERMKRLGRSVSKYAAFDAIRKELSWVQTFYIRNFPKWPTIDTAKVGIAEAATLIVTQLDTAGVDVDSLGEIAQSVASLMS